MCLQLDITILNVNDNRPKFPVSNVKLEMMKKAKVGHSFTLSPAHDKDGDQLTYSLLNFRSQFSVKYDKQTDKVRYTIYIYNYTRVYTIDIKNVDKQLTHAMHVKGRYANETFIDKLTKWHQWF